MEGVTQQLAKLSHRDQDQEDLKQLYAKRQAKHKRARKDQKGTYIGDLAYQKQQKQNPSLAEEASGEAVGAWHVMDEAETNRMIEQLLSQSNSLTRSVSRVSKMMRDDSTAINLLAELDSPMHITKQESKNLLQDISEMISNSTDANSLTQREGLIRECEGYLSDLINQPQFPSKMPKTALEFRLNEFMLQERSRKPKELFDPKFFTEFFPSLSDTVVNPLPEEQKREQLEKNKFFQGKEFEPKTYLPDKSKELNTHFHPYSNNSEGGVEVRDLLKEYEGMDIEDIKTIYRSLENLQLCRDFLRKFYSYSKSQERQTTPTPAKTTEPVRKPVNVRTFVEDPKIDEDIVKLSLEELREHVWHEMKLKAVLRNASLRTSAQKERKELQRLGRQMNSRFEQYILASQVKFIEKALKNHPHEIDFHGYFLSEAVDIAERYIEQLADSTRNDINNCRKLHQSLAIRHHSGKPVIELHIITGKGENSRNKQSVLKPAMQELCQKLKLFYKNTEGGVLAFIPF